MAGASDPDIPLTPTIMALGDSSVLVRFDTVLTDAANNAAITLARRLDAEPIPGVLEVAPNLVSVLLRYDPWRSSYAEIAGELRLVLSGNAAVTEAGKAWNIPVRFDGPDIEEVAASLGMTVPAFVQAHNARPLRVLSTGFAPGFVYCGLHPASLILPRRAEVRPMVPAGSVLFAAGQTAIAATAMPTGWHVIGRTEFSNFDPHAWPPTRLAAGDTILFEAAL